VTTDWVLTELADGLADPQNREICCEFIEGLRARADVTIIEAHRELFDAGLRLYAERQDKHWSLTDCISFVAMQQKGMTEALTGDRHFEQAGFVRLLKSPSPLLIATAGRSACGRPLERHQALVIRWAAVAHRGALRGGCGHSANATSLLRRGRSGLRCPATNATVTRSACGRPTRGSSGRRTARPCPKCPRGRSLRGARAGHRDRGTGRGSR
jgi:uncharacterized protein